jgi:Phage major capsid protein E
MTFPVMDNYSRFYQGLFDDRKMISVSKGFLSMFGNLESDDPSETHFIFDQEIFDIDIIRGDKTIGALVPRGITGTISDDEIETEQQSTEFNRIFPLGQKTGYINAQKLSKRLAGERPYSVLTRTERLQILAAKQHLSKMRQLMGLQELLASLSVLEGKMPAMLDTTNPSLIYDFRRNTDNIITVAIDWVAATLAQILDNIDDGVDAGRENGKVVCDMLTLGRGVWTPLLLKTGIEKYFDLRRINQGTIDTNIDLPAKFNRFVGNGGLEPRGRLVTPKGAQLWLFSYNQHYERPKGVIKYFLPEDQAMITYSGARADRYFGPSEILPRISLDDIWYEEMFGFTPDTLPMPEQTPDGDIFNSMMYHFHAYPSEDKKTIRTETQVAPVYATTQTDAFVTLKGLLP